MGKQWWLKEWWKVGTAAFGGQQRLVLRRILVKSDVVSITPLPESSLELCLLSSPGIHLRATCELDCILGMHARRVHQFM